MKICLPERQFGGHFCARALLRFTADAARPERSGLQLILAADVSGSLNALLRPSQDGYLEALGDSRVSERLRELDHRSLPSPSLRGRREQQVMVPWTRSRMPNDGFVPHRLKE